MRTFAQLFAGRDDVYGRYNVSKRKAAPGKKQEGDGKTITAPVTPDLWKKHLNGKQGLGIVAVRLDGTTGFFCIDVDIYGEDSLHTRFIKMIEDMNLPLVMTKSKSNGAHLWCFLEEPLPVKDVHRVTKRFLKVLGLPDDNEVFPKQETMQVDRKGSWINLPYFNGDVRVGFDGSKELSLEEFLASANQALIGYEDLQYRYDALDKTKAKDTGSEAPPCIDVMLANGIEEGGRDDALAHVSVYLSRAFPDDWQARLMDINSESVLPALKYSEVARIATSQERKPHQYMCQHAPMSAVCDKPTCMKRRYGVGKGEGIFESFTVDALRKIDSEDPIYFMTVEGKEIRMSTGDIMNFLSVKRLLFAGLNKVVAPMKQFDWETYLNTVTSTIMTIEAAPVITGEAGLIRQIFADWIARNSQRDSLERALDGQPYVDSKNQIWFLSIDFITHVKKRLSPSLKTQDIWSALGEWDSRETKKKIHGHPKKFWCVKVGKLWFTPHKTERKF